MNQKLTGYHVALEHAHLQLLGGILTLKGLTIIQEAHPHPPVADIAMLRFHIELKELFSRRVVTDVRLHRPRIHIDQTQFVAEKNSKVPLRQKGWQEALEAAYPFKINRITIDNGDVVYIQDAVNPPLHLGSVNFSADNIRNIHAPDNDYPSRFHATMVILDTGRASVDGHANFLEEPFPGARAHYRITNVPLSAFDPEIRQVNLTVQGGRLASDGLLESSPKVTRVDVNNATIADVGIGYVHSPATQKQEAQRVKATGEQIEKQNNRPAVDIAVREFDIEHSNFSYTDQTGNPNYKLFINDTDLTLKNLSNHQQQGPADASLHGKFMGSGNSTVSGTFLASAKYSQLAVKDGNIDGYVKPMFADLEVYNYQKDKNTPILHQAKELVIGGASHLLKSRRTDQVASDVDLKGKLTSPNVDIWQALGQVLRNAFIQAIIPGFDRAVGSRAGSDNARPAQGTSRAWSGYFVRSPPCSEVPA
jgi:hypothetical protein